MLTRPLRYRLSRKNPHYFATCAELWPPGGTTMVRGVLFADIRGFTSSSEGVAGDAVMALYLSLVHPGDAAPSIMVDHARGLAGGAGRHRSFGRVVWVSKQRIMLHGHGPVPNQHQGDTPRVVAAEVVARSAGRSSAPSWPVPPVVGFLRNLCPLSRLNLRSNSPSEGLAIAVVAL